jgi:Tfp pilus assembly PilM family ATPase
MTRRSVAFRQADVERAVKAALSAGLTVNSFEVSQSGTIRVITTNVKGETTPDLPYDEWKAKRDAGST